MNDLISRLAAIETLKKARFPNSPYRGEGTQIAIERIRELPKARLDARDIGDVLFYYFDEFHKEFPNRDEKNFVEGIVERAHRDWRETQRVKEMRHVELDAWNRRKRWRKNEHTKPGQSNKTEMP